MNGILLAGMTDHEAAAIEIMIGMNWRDQWEIVTIPRHLGLGVPAQTAAAQACGHCVIDLFGFGLRKHTPAHEASLMQFLAGRSAVLLSWGNGGGWLERDLPLAPGQWLHWVGVPYTSTDMLDALRKVHADARPPAGRRAAAGRAVAPAAASAAIGRLPAVSAPPPAPPDAHSLQTLLRVFPQLAATPLVALMARGLMAPGPQLLRVNDDVAFVAHPPEGWVASGLSMTALRRLMHAPQVMAGIDVAPLPADGLEQAVRGRFGGRFRRVQRPLDVIQWELASDMLADVPLAPRGDAAFRLHRFPNFTRLTGVGPLDVQLAAICARLPRSMGELARVFPRQEQAVYRFVALCVLAGLASVAPAAEQPAAAAPAAAEPARAPVRRGFLKSLLDKLF